MKSCKVFLVFFFLFFGDLGALPDQRIVFFHIPKSGGVTVSSLLMDKYHLDQLGSQLFSLGFHSSLFEAKSFLDLQSYKLIVFLRDPVDRVLSEHKYCIEQLKGNSEILIAHRLPPQGDPIETASNVACKILSGLNDKDFSIPDETHLMFAKKNLESFWFVGITEKMDESIDLLFSKIGQQKPEKIPYFNKTESLESFSNETICGIKERNWADIELYRYALELFDLQKNKIQPFLEKESAHFLSNIHYTVELPLDGYGWGVRENRYKGEPQNKVFRWVVEDNEGLVKLWLKPWLDYDFRCTVFIQPAFCHLFQVYVNGFSVFLENDFFGNHNEMDYKWITYTGKISKEAFMGEEKTRIILKMDPSISEFPQEKQPYRNIKRGNFAFSEIFFKQEVKKLVDICREVYNKQRLRSSLNEAIPNEMVQEGGGN